MCFPSAFEINSWHILNHSTRATEQIYVNRLESIPGGTQLEQGDDIFDL